MRRTSEMKADVKNEESRWWLISAGLAVTGAIVCLVTGPTWAWRILALIAVTVIVWNRWRDIQFTCVVVRYILARARMPLLLFMGIVVLVPLTGWLLGRYMASFVGAAYFALWLFHGVGRVFYENDVKLANLEQRLSEIERRLAQL